MQLMKENLIEIRVITLYSVATSVASHFIAQTAVLPLSITSATIAPSAVPNKHIQAVRESSAG